ncbi:hypothetical protein D3C86_2134720 [compost metagenome]
MLEGLLQHLILVAEGEILERLVDRGELLKQSVETLEAFVDFPGAFVLHQFLRGLNHQVGGVQQTVE